MDELLYNSSLIKNYLEYIKKVYPDLAVDSLLNYAGIGNCEVEDQGHWLSQRQIDRFHEILSKKTGDPGISRKVGRFAASSKSSSIISILRNISSMVDSGFRNVRHKASL